MGVRTTVDAYLQQETMSLKKGYLYLFFLVPGLLASLQQRANGKGRLRGGSNTEGGGGEDRTGKGLVGGGVKYTKGRVLGGGGGG